MEQKEHTALTFSQAKDQVAVKYAYTGWCMKIHENGDHFTEKMFTEAAELWNKSLTSQLSSALESYNRECKRNDELQAEVDRLRKQNDEATALLLDSVSKSQYIDALNEVDTYRELLTEAKSVLEWHLDKSGPNNTNDQSDFFNMTANVATQIESALSKFQPKKDESIK